MSTTKKERKGRSAVIPVRVPVDIQNKVRGLATHSRLSDADIMRMALDRGLPALEKLFGVPDKKAA